MKRKVVGVINKKAELKTKDINKKEVVVTQYDNPETSDPIVITFDGKSVVLTKLLYDWIGMESKIIDIRSDISKLQLELYDKTHDIDLKHDRKHRDMKNKMADDYTSIQFQMKQFAKINKEIKELKNKINSKKWWEIWK